MEEKKISTCPFCNGEVASGAKKCKHCGEWIMQQCPHCMEWIGITDKKCPYCCGEIPIEDVEHEHGESQSKLQIVSNTTRSDDNPTTDMHLNPQAKLSGWFAHYYADVYFKHYADFSGKLGRKQYWIGYLFYGVSCIPLLTIDTAIGLPVITSIYMLGMLIPSIAATIRRLHDIGKSGWWYLISLLPFIGTVWLLVLLCRKGETSNRPTQTNVTDLLIFSLIAIVTVVGLVTSPKEGNTLLLQEPQNYETYHEEEQASENIYIPVEEPAQSHARNAAATDKTETITMKEKPTPKESSTPKGTNFAGTSTSGQYSYYIEKKENKIYQKDNYSGELYFINLEQAFDDVFIYSIIDHATSGNKLVFITDNGATGSFAGYDAFYLDMDDETWHYIAFARIIQFIKNKTALETSDGQVYDLKHL